MRWRRGNSGGGGWRISLSGPMAAEGESWVEEGGGVEGAAPPGGGNYNDILCFPGIG
ncbi:expressed unknown protein [Ectocarpus siliculosus]|uniref:Uncharacterized protein n=1 Tax=Ectocarpus siliculosus TaxID=2880 RepID=D7FT25_ECTSI|nr:expressed unknown protein [Ectocarpus siliculosus]|eukprot:CBJ31316.1 expressed unknown protein [Ectocarpus siliculosus]